MARHRNVRSMNYDEEYDGFDDVYGHSVEDDYASSPSMQHFLYDRSQGHQMSAFIQSDIPEEEEVSDPDAPDGNIPNIQNPALLNDIEKAQLNSCLDAVQDRIGNNFTEQAAINAILWANYDVDKAVNRLLTGSLPTDINTKSEMKTAKKKDNLLSSQGQDIKSKSHMDKKPNLLGQLASLHLSKTKQSQSVDRPNLSQLASLNISQASAKQAQPMQRLNLAQLAKINIQKVTDSAKTSTRPTLSELAKVNLNSRKSNEVVTMQLPHADHSHVDFGMNLTSALRNKTTSYKERKIPLMNPMAKKNLFLPLMNESVLVDPLVSNVSEPSSLGLVISRVRRRPSRSIFFKFNRNSMTPCYKSSAILPFDFSSPSPDDLIKSRLRIA